MLSQFTAAEFGHHDIRDCQMNKPFVALCDFKSVITVRCDQHVVALLLQVLAGDLPDFVLIFNDQDGFGTLNLRKRLCFKFYGFLTAGCLGKIDSETASMPKLAMKRNPSATLLNGLCPAPWL